MDTLVVIVNLLLLAVLSVWLYRRTQADLKVYFWPALIVRIAAGLFVGLVYTYYYKGGDTLFYYQDGQTLTTLARDNFTSYLRFIFF